VKRATILVGLAIVYLVVFYSSGKEEGPAPTPTASTKDHHQSHKPTTPKYPPQHVPNPTPSPPKYTPSPPQKQPVPLPPADTVPVVTTPGNLNPRPYIRPCTETEKAKCKAYAKGQVPQAKEGATNPWDHKIKEDAVMTLQKRFGSRIMVETGTWHGDMVKAMEPHFDKIYTIEFAKNLYMDNSATFCQNAKVKCLLGDSGKLLKNLVQNYINEHDKVLFWLDGHYSVMDTAKADLGSPIIEEIRTLLMHPWANNFAILVDDARLFKEYPTGEDAISSGYPSTPEFQDLVCQLDPTFHFELIGDVFWIYPSV
jgi:hypothetical protein